MEERTRKGQAEFQNTNPLLFSFGWDFTFLDVHVARRIKERRSLMACLRESEPTAVSRRGSHLRC